MVDEYQIALNELKQQSNLHVPDDSHVFLVLDKHLQGIPWECIYSLKGKSVSRIPSYSFLLDRL